MKAMPLKTITPKSHEENNIKVNKSINQVITQCLALVHYFNIAIFKRFLVSCIIFQPKIVGIFIYWFNFDPPKNSLLPLPCEHKGVSTIKPNEKGKTNEVILISPWSLSLHSLFADEREACRDFSNSECHWGSSIYQSRDSPADSNQLS